jgi:hypothetical protein
MDEEHTVPSLGTDDKARLHNFGKNENGFRVLTKLMGFGIDGIKMIERGSGFALALPLAA